jgi:hypothetical protein
MTRYFDDVAVGDTFESQASEDITRDAILSFARAWDPQAYHIDEEVAKASFAGGLSASDHPHPRDQPEASPPIWILRHLADRWSGY